MMKAGKTVFKMYMTIRFRKEMVGDNYNEQENFLMPRYRKWAKAYS